MTIKIKLKTATYQIDMDGVCLTARIIYMGKDKDGNDKEQSKDLGYYGPGQIDLSINRIIAEEINRDQDTVNLREFLIRYKAIHESIAGQVAELKEVIKQNRLQTT